MRRHRWARRLRLLRTRLTGRLRVSHSADQAFSFVIHVPYPAIERRRMAATIGFIATRLVAAELPGVIVSPPLVDWEACDA